MKHSQKAESDLCVVNSDIPEEKHNVYFPSCRVRLENYITHVFQHWAPLMSVPTSGTGPEMTLRAAIGWATWPWPDLLACGVSTTPRSPVSATFKSKVPTEEGREARDIGLHLNMRITATIISTAKNKSQVSAHIALTLRTLLQGQVVYFSNPRTLETEAGESEVQDHSWLYSEFKASLNYMKLYNFPALPPPSNKNSSREMMVQWVKTLSVKLDDLNSIPRPLVLKGQNWLANFHWTTTCVL